MKLLILALLGGCLALAFAAPAANVRWCVTSDPELRKCVDLVRRAPVFTCVKRTSTYACLQAIKASEADAITLDGEDIFQAGLNNFDLHPIIAEDYGMDTDTCYYAVAVVKSSTTFSINDLRGKKSCHSGSGKPGGGDIYIGTLVASGIIKWEGSQKESLEVAMSNFFSTSCVPGVTGFPNLCQSCKGDCSRSRREPYYGFNGAFQCLAEGSGDVAFVKHTTVPENVKGNYKLLCKDGSRASIDSYKTCHWAKLPAHAVVSRKNPELAKLIYKSLTTVRGFNLFSSANYAPSKDLMFKDSTTSLVELPQTMDSFLYLGAEYMSIIKSLKKENSETIDSNSVIWCAVGHAETTKCDSWSTESYENGKAQIECLSASTVEACLNKIMRNEADAMSIDGGQIYTAGKCGLIPVMQEQYSEELCGSTASSGVASSYYAVAVVKRASGVTWNNLRGKRSCHTGIGRTAGWNIPMGHIHSITKSCNFSEFFPRGCAPGADLSSTFCSQCAGGEKAVGDNSKCQASTDEKYYGYSGAFRCLVENAGDVAFIKHTIVQENSNKKDPEWVRGVRTEDYGLICPGRSTVAPITDYTTCNLAKVPSHAVVTRPEIRSKVIRILQQQQSKFGTDSTESLFKLFESKNGKNLLFKDSTKCIQEVDAGMSYESFLGPDYMRAMTSIRECTASTPDLEKSCSFISCQQKN